MATTNAADQTQNGPDSNKSNSKDSKAGTR